MNIVNNNVLLLLLYTHIHLLYLHIPYYVCTPGHIHFNLKKGTVNKVNLYNNDEFLVAVVVVTFFFI